MAVLVDLSCTQNQYSSILFYKRNNIVSPKWDAPTDREIRSKTGPGCIDAGARIGPNEWWICFPVIIELIVTV